MQRPSRTSRLARPHSPLSAAAERPAPPQKQAEVQAALEEGAARMASFERSESATPRTDTVFQRQRDKMEKEQAKLLAKLTRLRVEARADGVVVVAGGEWPSTSEQSLAVVQASEQRYQAVCRRIQVYEEHLLAASAKKASADTALDEAVSAAYRTTVLQQHPDKRKSGSQTDTLTFQRLRTAYETLHDGDLRRRYIKSYDHDQFLSERSAEAAAAAAASQEDSLRADRRKAGSGKSGKALALTGGVPNRCTCPVVSVVEGSDGAALLQWGCHRAQEYDVSGYELQGCLVGKARGPWVTLAEPLAQRTMRRELTGLQPGEWSFRVRAAALGGCGDWSMASEGMVLGGAVEDDPEAVARRRQEAQQRSVARKLEAQECARDNLTLWAQLNARRAPDALEQVARALSVARRAGLPVRASDAGLLQRADDALRELRLMSQNRQAMAEWRPLLRVLVRRALTDDTPEAARELRGIVEGASAEETLSNPGVRDTMHQLIKRLAADCRAYTAHEERVSRVLDVLHAAAQRNDLWSAEKVKELVDLAQGLSCALEKELMAAARRRSAEAREAQARAEAQAARELEQQKASQAQARLVQQARTRMALAQQLAAPQAAQGQARTPQQVDPVAPVAARPLAAPPAPAAALRPLAAASPRPAPPPPAATWTPSWTQRLDSVSVSGRSEFECPVCMDAFCSSEDKEPVSFACGHSVCAACLADLRLQHPKCTVCRQPFHPQAHIPVNVPLQAAALRDLAARAAAEQALKQPPVGEWRPAPPQSVVQQLGPKQAAVASPPRTAHELFPWLC